MAIAEVKAMQATASVSRKDKRLGARRANGQAWSQQAEEQVWSDSSM
jgi:hypothetical protein